MKNEKQALVPRLRFPEFREAGEWAIRPLGKILSIGNGKDHKHLPDGDVPVYGSGGYMRSVNNYLYDGESVCIGRKGTIDKPVFLKGKFWTVDTLFYTHSFMNAVPRFVFALFQNIEWLKHNEAGGVPSLSKTNIAKIEVAIPEVNEQQKIADCLSSLDALIAAQADKIDALKTHKKGLMQQLFPREGETIPRLRFPEFREAGEWEPKFLGAICDNISSGKDKSDSEGLYDLYGSTGIIGKTANGSYSGVYILVARVGANAGALTKSEGTFGVTDNTLVLHLKDLEMINFVYFWLDRVGLNKLVFGSGQPLVTGKQLKELELCFPSHKEQEEIANCLLSLDDLIVTHTEKLDALKNHKQGLIQQLFPIVEGAAS